MPPGDVFTDGTAKPGRDTLPPVALTPVQIESDTQPLPPEAAAIIEAATACSSEFVEARLDDPVPGFVPCDFESVYRALRAVRARFLSPGTMFLEWGSGTGGVAALADLVGFQSYGIEINPELVTQSRDLARRFGRNPTIAQGTFIPRGAERLADKSTAEFLWLMPGGEDAYDQLGLDINDFDTVFAYPWPGEEDILYTLFDRKAASGALLITYNGAEGIKGHRRSGSRK